jgi:ubiquinone/menaquinone biosynthesis C-methylase UbiE
VRGLEQIPWLYDAMCALPDRLFLRAWRRWLGTGTPGRILDIGCGTGRNLPFLPPGAVGLDPSWPSLLRARRRVPAARLILGSAEDLPFRRASFDTVVSGLVFCSVSDPRRGLAEVKRVLRPAGELRMLEHVRSTKRWGARWQDVIQPAWTRLSGGCHPNRDTERNVETAGFTIAPDSRRARGTLRRFTAQATERV